MYFVAGPSPTSSDLWFYVYMHKILDPVIYVNSMHVYPCLFVHLTQGQLY